MSSIIDLLSGPPPARGNNKGCQVGRRLNELTPQERDLVLDRLDDPDWTHAAVARALGLKPSAMGHHTRKVCSCDQ